MTGDDDEGAAERLRIRAEKVKLAGESAMSAIEKMRAGGARLTPQELIAGLKWIESSAAALRKRLEAELPPG